MKITLLLCLFIFPTGVFSQNVGIGITSPLQRLHINGGNFLIQEALSQTNTAPTVAQTVTMINAGSTQLPAADSTNKIYDPGGASGNYLANLSSGVFARSATDCVGFEVTINSIGLGSGDSLIISELSLWRNVQLAIGNNYSTTGSFTFNTPTLYFTFKSNSDASTGSGFDITIKRKYRASVGTPVQTITGNGFLYESQSSNLQIGSNNHVFGSNGFVFGNDNQAFGDHSVAIGLYNAINGIALGYGLEGYWDGQHTVVLGKWNSSVESLGFPDQLALVVGGGSPGARSNAMEVYDNGFAYHKGYVQLGENAPLIKNALITGYNMPSTDNSWVFIPIPSDISDVNKIVSFQVICTNSVWQYIPNTTHPGSYFRTNIDQRNIAVGTFSGQSANLYGKPIKVFITYSFY